jgi:opacity protein-like surface antigen
MKKGLLALSISLALGNAAFGADMPLKALAPVSATPCAPQNCSGWYAGFGVLGDGTNADIVGNGINGSVFAAGGAIKVQGGYQLWNGSWFAAIDGSVGYEFTTNRSPSLTVVSREGSRVVGTELIKLGYNFLNTIPPATPSALTAPGQAPASFLAPASILAMSTPYLTFGGMQRRGVNQWVSGAGVQTIVAAGWSTDIKYLYAPTQENIPATNVVMIELNKHF